MAGPASEDSFFFCTVDVQQRGEVRRLGDSSLWTD